MIGKTKNFSQKLLHLFVFNFLLIVCEKNQKLLISFVFTDLMKFIKNINYRCGVNNFLPKHVQFIFNILFRKNIFTP